MAGHNLDFRLPSMLPSEIRLLYLQPSPCFGYAIICSLITLERTAAETQYEALSYVWGMSEGMYLRPITVNNKSYRITQNLDSALRHLRHKNRERVLWVDAICLDQNDVEEKNRVVPEMHIIYGSAKRVLAWVGKANTSTAMAVELVKSLMETRNEIFSPSLDSNERQEYLVDLVRWKQANGYLPRPDSEVWETLNNLFSHEWWDRVWTLQEVVYARKYKLIWGNTNVYTVSGHNLANALQFMRQLEVHRLVSDSIAETLVKSFSKSWRLMEIEEFRTGLGGRQPISLGAALAASRHRAATNKRDHVYGCLSLANNVQSRIRVDYSNAVLRVFEDATRALVDEGRSNFGGLNFLGSCSSSRSDKLDSLTPSWTLFLDQINDYEDLCAPFGSNLQFKAAGSHPSVAVYPDQQISSLDSPYLTVRGLCFDQVEIVGTILFPSTSPTTTEDSGQLMSNFYIESRRILRRLCLSGKLKSAATAYTNLRHVLIYDIRIGQSEFPVENGLWSSAYTRYARSSCSGRRFFVTKRGYMGLAPHASQSGDYVFLVMGCDVPLILRKAMSNATGPRREHARKCYKIVGNACEFAFLASFILSANKKLTTPLDVHGIMHGEAADNEAAFTDVNLI
jgi:hypothetical protein